MHCVLKADRDNLRSCVHCHVRRCDAPSRLAEAGLVYLLDRLVLLEVRWRRRLTYQTNRGVLVSGVIAEPRCRCSSPAIRTGTVREFPLGILQLTIAISNSPKWQLLNHADEALLPSYQAQHEHDQGRPHNVPNLDSTFQLRG